MLTELQCTLKEKFQLLQVLGAIWYLLSIQRQESCWRLECRNNATCNANYIYCGAVNNSDKNAFLKNVCILCDQPNSLPDPVFGIYAPAIENITQSRSFFVKLFFCVWWGLQNLRCVQKTTTLYICILN